MRWLRVALAVAGLLLGIAAETASYWPGDPGAAVLDLAVGLALLGCGVVAWDHRGRSRFGLLMTAAGVAWFLGSLWPELVYLHRGPLVHALLSYPSGRLPRRLGRVVVTAAYLDGAIEPLGASPFVTLVLCAAIAVAAVDGYLVEVGPRRRARLVATAGASAVALVVGAGATARLMGWNIDVATLWTYEVVLVVVALGLLGDLMRGRWSQSAVTGLVVDLGQQREPATLRDRLARALGDSSLQLGWWLGRRTRLRGRGGPAAPLQRGGRGPCGDTDRE